MSGGPVRARWPQQPGNLLPFLPPEASAANDWDEFVEAFRAHYTKNVCGTETTRKDFVTDEPFPERDDENRLDTLLRFAAVFRNDPSGIRGPGRTQYAGVATVELRTVTYTWKVGDRVAGCGYLLDCEKLPGDAVLARIQITPRL